MVEGDSGGRKQDGGGRWWREEARWWREMVEGGNKIRRLRATHDFQLPQSCKMKISPKSRTQATFLRLIRVVGVRAGTLTLHPKPYTLNP